MGGDIEKVSLGSHFLRDFNHSLKKFVVEIDETLSAVLGPSGFKVDPAL